MQTEESRVPGNAYFLKVIRRDPCVYCGRLTTTEINNSASYTKDHIHPRTRGGINNWTNIAPSCATCNRQKDHLSLLEFLLGFKPGQSVLRSNKQREYVKMLKLVPIEERAQQPARWFSPLTIEGDTVTLQMEYTDDS